MEVSVGSDGARLALVRGLSGHNGEDGFGEVSVGEGRTFGGSCKSPGKRPREHDGKVEVERTAELQEARRGDCWDGNGDPSEAGLVVKLWSVRKRGARVMMGKDECSIICLGSHVSVRYSGILSPKKSPPS